MRANGYSEADLRKMIQMKKDGSSLDEIAGAVGRSKKSIQMKMWKLNSGRDQKPKSDKKLTKRKYTRHAAAVENQVKNRPMIALVGEPKEVTETIKQLFS